MWVLVTWAQLFLVKNNIFVPNWWSCLGPFRSQRALERWCALKFYLIDMGFGCHPNISPTSSLSNDFFNMGTFKNIENHKETENLHNSTCSRQLLRILMRNSNCLTGFGISQPELSKPSQPHKTLIIKTTKKTKEITQTRLDLGSTEVPPRDVGQAWVLGTFSR